MTIKALNNADCPFIVDLILPIQQVEFNVPVTLEGQPDLLDLDTYYYATGGCFWGAFIEGELIGTIALISTGHQAGALRKMFVKKEFRGKEHGIARQLLQVLLAFCKAHGINELYLGTVDMLKAAHRFYERNGFQRIEAAALPPYFPRMAADNRYYHLSLKEPDECN
ncbi:GNAT family N-acetyltransferase [Anseongella ginsenosidimutans]|nr:GNAT family N-acetyltransferase [Anseongella ginsenosidimutans]